MSVTPTAIAGLFVIDSQLIEDSRGFFRESYRLAELSQAVGRNVSFRQANHSRSKPGVIRGFHAEPWDKLIYVVRGTAFCAVADIRVESETYGTALTFMLGDEPGHRQRLFISRGLANAFQAIAETDYVNDVSEEFDQAGRHGIAWDDPTLSVAWPILPPTLSAQDSALPRLSSIPRPAEAFAPAPAGFGVDE